MLYSTVGSGQTRSWQWGGQNSRILSNRYCLLSIDSPGGGMIDGKSSLFGSQLLFFTRTISRSGLFTVSFTTADPGFVSVKVRWCMDLMPFKAACLNGVSKNFAQS